MKTQAKELVDAHNEKVSRGLKTCDGSYLLSSFVGEEPYGGGSVRFYESDLKESLEVQRRKLVPKALALCKIAGVELKYVIPRFAMSSCMGGFFAKTIVEECKQVDYHIGVNGNSKQLDLFDKLIQAYRI